jgi:hypothetical protein
MPAGISWWLSQRRLEEGEARTHSALPPSITNTLHHTGVPIASYVVKMDRSMTV